MIDLNETIIEKKNFFNRLVFVYLFFGMLFLFFLYRTFSLQVSSFTDYEIASLKNRTREVLVQPTRGIIYDRKGNILVNNVPSYDLIIKPWKIENLDNFIEKISKIISLNKKEIDYIDENFSKKALYNRELTIKRNLTTDEIARFEVRNFRYPNAFIDVRYSRQNKYPYLFSHAIGYVGGVSNEQLNEILINQEKEQKETLFKYSGGFLIGKTGLENIISKKCAVFYKDMNDLIIKIQKFKKNDKSRIKIAKNGRYLYHKYFNSTLVSDYIIKKTFDFRYSKKFRWEK